MREDLARLSGAAVGSTIDLKQAPNANLGGVFWLNAGLALENLLKGIIVQDDPASVVNGTITNPLKTHNLLRLATRASVPLDPVEGFFLWVGTECVKWAGRYPCSTSPDESAPPVFSEADVMAYRGLFSRLSGRFTGCDSNSTDGTGMAARAAGARVVRGMDAADIAGARNRGLDEARGGRMSGG